MPGAEIKMAVVKLLDVHIDKSALKHVNDQYPRLSEQLDAGDFPRAIVSVVGKREAGIAGGGGPNLQTMQADWRVVIHVAALLDEPLSQGASFDKLLDDIENLFRLYPDLEGVASTESSKVLNCPVMERDTPPPDRAQLQNAYNSFINVTVREYVASR